MFLRAISPEYIRRAGSRLGIKSAHLCGCTSKSWFLSKPFDALDALEFEIQIQIASVRCYYSPLTRSALREGRSLGR